jgi:S1-C subfamily serine protease
MISRVVLVVALVALVVGCKTPRQQSAVNPDALSGTAQQASGQGAPGKASSSQVDYEEIVVTVTLPGRDKANATESVVSSTGRKGHPGCPKTESGLILGIEISRPHGCVVGSVLPGGPAETAGIKVGDSIVACEGTAVSCPSVLLPLLPQGGGEAEVKLTIRRAQAKDAKPADSEAKAPDKNPE